MNFGFKSIVLVFAVVISSCKNAEQKTEESTIPITRKELNSEVNKTVANLTIGGMTCAEGCGGKIQKELQALNGVTSTKLDYEDSRTENIVSVEFDPEVVNEMQMIECVKGIMDGKYEVKTVEILTYHGLRSSSVSVSTSVGTFDAGKVIQIFSLLQAINQLAV